MGTAARGTVRSQLQRIIEHLLKLEHSPAGAAHRMDESIDDARGEIENAITPAHPAPRSSGTLGPLRPGARRNAARARCPGREGRRRALPRTALRLRRSACRHVVPANRHGLRTRTEHAATRCGARQWAPRACRSLDRGRLTCAGKRSLIGRIAVQHHRASLGGVGNDAQPAIAMARRRPARGFVACGGRKSRTLLAGPAGGGERRPGELPASSANSAAARGLERACRGGPGKSTATIMPRSTCCSSIHGEQGGTTDEDASFRISAALLKRYSRAARSSSPAGSELDGAPSGPLLRLEAQRVE